MELNRIIANLTYVSNNLIQITLEVLDEHEVQIKELIHLQLGQGIRGDGQLISPQYSPGYAKKKRRTVPDLKVTGQFWNDIFTEIEGDVLKISSTRKEKGFDLAEHLEQRYTSKIYELTKQNQEKLKKIIFEGMYNKIQNYVYK